MPAFADLLKDFFYDPDEDVGLSFKPRLDPDEMTLAAKEAPPQEYLSFELEREWYALPLRQVREIVKVSVLTEIPRSTENLLGVTKIRGEVLPVYDIKVRLKLADRAPRIAGPEAELAALPRSARILVIRETDGQVGVLVDSVRDVVRLRASSIEPPAAGIGDDRNCVLGLGHLGEELLILLDIHQALS